jgi:hypothetical protein
MSLKEHSLCRDKDYREMAVKYGLLLHNKNSLGHNVSVLGHRAPIDRAACDRKA